VNVGPGDSIVLHYKLSSSDGTEIESTFDDAPIELTLGQGELAWNLENCLLGLPLNERHVFMLEATQAFGSWNESLVQRLPLTEFPADMSLAPQMMIEFQLPNGTTMPGVVREIDQSEAVVDFNHPLSDCPVNFEVEVLEIKRPGSNRSPDSH